MKRFGVKAVGLGLALAAGSALAAEGDWRAPGQPVAVEVVPTGGPALLPAPLRAPAPKADSGPIWLPAQKPAAQPPVVRTGAAIPDPDFAPAIPPAPQRQPQAQPQPKPTQWPPEPQQPQQSFGPRSGGDVGPLPAIPTVPDAAVPQPQPQPVPKSDPIPPPREVEPKPPIMIPPRAPEFLPPAGKGDPLPLPRPLDPEPKPGELQPAPSGLMYPAGALDCAKPGGFGSAPIRLTRDFPPVHDLIQKGHVHDGITITDDTANSGGAFNRFFASGEYLLWWLPGFATPVIGTTNPNTALNGFLGEPGTTAIIGPGPFIDSARSGVRVRAGAWIDDCGSCGIDAGFFILPTRSASVMVNSGQFPLITRPVFVPNLVPGTNQPLGENGESVAVPGILSGALTARGESELWGFDVNARKCLLNNCDARAELFAGYRYLNLRESLTITENITVIGPGGNRVNVTDPIGTRVFVQDQFKTRNEFNGAQLGALYERRWGSWSLTARGALGLGDTHQVLEINGIQIRQQPGAAPMSFRGGLLAAGPNIGRFTRDRFSVVPELTLNVGYNVTPNLRLFAGYNFLLWTNVIRPGDQIDHVVDLTFVPNAPPAGFSGLNRPRPLFRERDLVVNGIQFGADWRW